MTISYYDKNYNWIPVRLTELQPWMCRLQSVSWDSHINLHENWAVLFISPGLVCTADAEGLPVDKRDDHSEELRVQSWCHGLQTLQSCELRAWHTTTRHLHFDSFTASKKTRVCFEDGFLPAPSPWPASSGPPLKEVEGCSPLVWCLKIREDSSSREQPRT